MQSSRAEWPGFFVLPGVKKIGFIASETGAVVKYDPAIHAVKEAPKPAGPLTRHQRATLYFKALRFADALLREVGFYTVADLGHSGFVIEMDNFILEAVVKEAPQVAHVTSYPGYQYDPKKINAKVEMMVPVEGRDYVIQMSASYPRTGTTLPTFVVIRQDSPDVLKEAFMGILTTARDFIQKDPNLMAKIQAAMAQRDLERDLERLQSDDAKREARACPGPTVARPAIGDGRRSGVRHGGANDDSIPT